MILDSVTIGEGAIVRHAILDKNVVVADGRQIGVDPAPTGNAGSP